MHLQKWLRRMEIQGSWAAHKGIVVAVVQILGNRAGIEDTGLLGHMIALKNRIGKLI
jgi:hypothetical protein